MIIVGLTGSIAMGKSSAARAFRCCGVCVYDADGEIHKLMGPGGGALEVVSNAFPGVLAEDYIDRAKLGALVFADDAALARLEAILHPLAARAREKFLALAARRGERLVVLDIPLLMETGGDVDCDFVVVVSAPPFVQRQRVLARPGMTPERLRAILERQLPDLEKRRRADFIVQTGLGHAFSLRAIARMVDTIGDQNEGTDHA